jgi:hypothetical protein
VRLPLTYVLPLRWGDDGEAADLTRYLQTLAPLVEDLIVVDGSPEPLAAGHRVMWRGLGRVVPPDPDLRSANGKVDGVVTGLRAARHDRVVVADDDVRYDRDGLAAVADLLDRHEVVRPQNVFVPLTWHAWWDTGRTLLNRALGGDYPGTLGVRRSALPPHGYDGDVMFENLELIRTVVARGGREAVARDVFVVRRPPTARHFLGQRVRQAYDDLAQPPRLALFLLLGPAVLASRRPGRAALVVAAAAVALAERGRRRDGGREVFPPSTSFAAPLWVAERAVCSWLALAARLRGGVRYRGGRIRRAATPVRRLRDRPPAVPSPVP